MEQAKTDKSDDIFSTFLITEKELAYTEKIHAQVAVRQMAKDFKDRQDSATLIRKIKDFFQDCKDSKQLTKIKKEAERKMALLPDEEKCDKEIDHNGYKHGNFKTHIFFEKKYTERHIMADCGGFHFPVIEYEVYIRIEYSPAEIWTQQYFHKTFNSYEEAENYYYELRNKYKNMKPENLIEKLTDKINKHCAELRQRIESFDIE